MKVRQAVSKTNDKKVICAALAAVLMLLAGYSGGGNPAEGYLELINSPSTILNNVWYNTGGIFHCAVFDVLVTTEADMQTIKPALAEKYDRSEDGLTYEFTLRENVKWHDGDGWL